MVAALGRRPGIIPDLGRYDTPLDHLLVADIVTRRIRRLYQETIERFEDRKARWD